MEALETRQIWILGSSIGGIDSPYGQTGSTWKIVVRREMHNGTVGVVLHRKSSKKRIGGQKIPIPAQYILGRINNSSLEILQRINSGKRSFQVKQGLLALLDRLDR